MKTGLLIFMLYLVLPDKGVAAQDIAYLRASYQKTVSDKKLCRSLIDQLSNQPASSVHLAYLGALQTIWANHTANPFAKLTTFNKGKKNIEKAVKAAPRNVEIRILRLSVQKNCPGFLGYRDAVHTDMIFLTDNRDSISSPDLRKMMAMLLHTY